MGIWKEIKYALNSTLGTSKFKPLDKIILDNRSWAASDDTTLATFYNIHNYVFPYNQDNKFGTFHTELGGVLRLRVNWSFGTAQNKAAIKIYENGKLVHTFNNPTLYGELVENDFDFLVNPNSNYTLYINSNSSTSYVNIPYININGTILNTSFGSFSFEQT